jgi:23S rRNA pseudouridine1911/1915/1917 synthase
MADSRWVVLAEEARTRLDKFLAAPERLGSRSRAATALERGKVFLNDTEATSEQAALLLAEGDAVRVWMDRPGSSKPLQHGWTGRGDHNLHIVYDDDEVLVVDKPAGLLTVPLERQEDAASVYEILQAHLKSRRRHAFVVHRIDRDTSGLVVFAKDRRAQQRLRDQFRRHEAERIYLAVVYGHPAPPTGTWIDHLVWDARALIMKETHPRDPQGKEAICEYRTAETFERTALLEIRLQTGKRNQIRLQARLRGHTLVGERRYTYGPEALRPLSFPRQALHAHRLAFEQPTTGERLEFESPLAADIDRLLAKLRRV